MNIHYVWKKSKSNFAQNVYGYTLYTMVVYETFENPFRIPD